MIKTYIISFIVVYIIYFTHSLYSCVFPFFWKMTLFLLEIYLPHSFWPRCLKQTLFYRELNALDLYRHSFCIFHLIPVKTIQNIKKYAQKCKILEKRNSNIFLNFIFPNFKNGACGALLEGLLNEIESTILLYL